ncbi:THAP domain-containing 9 [Paramuricea clavata]|uniref:THAP domain-containing 9 n=1 Tax=Paramuricea clavata TaxID=317549 RepID=A0A7D9DSI9_PARCT|nr:THAP domain-containing 9 [Paramuricea clavata]
MSDIIKNLQNYLIIKTEIADRLHKSFDKLQLSIFHNAKNNTLTSPCGRRYTDDIKEFSLTLYYYSPKAYEHVRSVIPLPNPSLIRKWSSSVNCEPGFLDEAFQSLKVDAEK